MFPFESTARLAATAEAIHQFMGPNSDANRMTEHRRPPSNRLPIYARPLSFDSVEPLKICAIHATFEDFNFTPFAIGPNTIVDVPMQFS